jgi:anti-anti-sigma regulatory factor
VGGFRPIPEVRDLVIDLSGYLELDVALLGMLLTAREKAAEEGKAVWLAGLHVQLWQALHAMGLARLFRAFPASEQAAV